MRKRCIYCGRSWHISILQEIPASGYECPRCTGKRKRAQQRARVLRLKEKIS